MVAFGHTAVGTLVGLGVYHYLGTSQPEVGVIVAGGAGIISHYVTDFIPHGHFFKHRDFKRLVKWDILFNFCLSVLFFAGVAFSQVEFGWKFWYVLFGIGGAQLPDILDGFYYLEVLPHSGLFKIENSFHQNTHWHGIFKHGKLVDGQPLRKSDFWQLAVFIIAFLVLVS
jgi:hypothetical protein